MKHRDHCTCVFCHLHCQECESTNLDVEFKPVLRFLNNIKNELDITWEGSEIEVICQDCGDSFRHTDWEEDPVLERLAAGIGDAIGLGHGISVEINDEGAVNHTAYVFVPTKKVA